MVKLVNCKTCEKEVSNTAPTCPHCGEEAPGLHIKCPKCKSMSISVGKKGFGLGKAAAGGILLGPVGLPGGMAGRKKIELVCKACGARWKPNPKDFGAPEKKKSSLGCLMMLLILLVIVGVITTSENEEFADTSVQSIGSESDTIKIDDATISDAICASDDFDKHKEIFIDASRKLILDKKCSIQILRYNGGWVRSQNYRDKKVYFTYLAGKDATVNDRIYLDVERGKIFR